MPELYLHLMVSIQIVSVPEINLQKKGIELNFQFP